MKSLLLYLSEVLIVFCVFGGLIVLLAWMASS